MRLSRIRAKVFMNHDALDLRVPDRGIVLVTGTNGSGKSSIAEAVATAFWGQTIRRTKPWRREADGEVEVEADVASARRFRRGQKVGLTFEAPGTEPARYENTTKAQAALEASVGSFDLWARSSVFHLEDVAGFTRATDGERKRLLEVLLGLERFEAALDACRKKLGAERKAEEVAGREVLRLDQALASQRQRLTEAEEALAVTAPEEAAAPPVDRAQVLSKMEALTASERSLRGELAQWREELRNAQVAGGTEAARAEEAQRQLQRVQAATCPSCSQAIPEELRARLRDEVARLRSAVKAAREAASASATDAQAQAAEVEEALSGLTRKRAELEAAARAALAAHQAAARLDEQRAHHERVAASASAEIVRLAREVEEARAALLEYSGRRKLLECVEVALGLRGIRAHVLGSALAGLQRLADSWMRRLTGGRMGISLKAHTEKAKGGVADAISLEIEGAGEGEGYRGCSQGERRRVDVAMLLALAEMAGAAAGRTGGTIFFDEVFDGLDREGLDAVVEALGDLALERAVVVITHRRDLASRLGPVAHWRFGDAEGQEEAGAAAGGGPQPGRQGGDRAGRRAPDRVRGAGGRPAVAAEPEAARRPRAGAEPRALRDGGPDGPG